VLIFIVVVKITQAIATKDLCRAKFAPMLRPYFGADLIHSEPRKNRHSSTNAN